MTNDLDGSKYPVSLVQAVENSLRDYQESSLTKPGTDEPGTDYYVAGYLRVRGEKVTAYMDSIKELHPEDLE